MKRLFPSTVILCRPDTPNSSAATTSNSGRVSDVGGRAHLRTRLVAAGGRVAVPGVVVAGLGLSKRAGQRSDSRRLPLSETARTPRAGGLPPRTALERSARASRFQLFRRRRRQ